MCYMTTKTPLDPDSWVYNDDYFKTTNQFRWEFSNNHTHLQKYKDKYYLLYHAIFPSEICRGIKRL